MNRFEIRCWMTYLTASLFFLGIYFLSPTPRLNRTGNSRPLFISFFWILVLRIVWDVPDTRAKKLLTDQGLAAVPNLLYHHFLLLRVHPSPRVFLGNDDDALA